jgi:hypothetical protein
MGRAIFLIVVLVVLCGYLAARLWSERRAWQPKLDRLESEIQAHEDTIDLAKRLVVRHNLSRDTDWRLWSGPPEDQQVLARLLKQDELDDAGPANIDPLSPS